MPGHDREILYRTEVKRDELLNKITKLRENNVSTDPDYSTRKETLDSYDTRVQSATNLLALGELDVLISSLGPI